VDKIFNGSYPQLANNFQRQLCDWMIEYKQLKIKVKKVFFNSFNRPYCYWSFFYIHKQNQSFDCLDMKEQS